jgi:hypothetical protein
VNKLTSSEKAQLTRKIRMLSIELDRCVADKGLWDPTLSKEDQQRNKNFVSAIRRDLAALHAQRSEPK